MRSIVIRVKSLCGHEPVTLLIIADYVTAQNEANVMTRTVYLQISSDHRESMPILQMLGKLN